VGVETRAVGDRLVSEPGHPVALIEWLTLPGMIFLQVQITDAVDHVLSGELIHGLSVGSGVGFLTGRR